jgi:hypothetical protein
MEDYITARKNKNGEITLIETSESRRWLTVLMEDYITARKNKNGEITLIED